VQVAGQLGEHPIDWRIDQGRFARLAEPLLQRMRTPLERAMRDARLQPEQISEIVLVGGASRMPMISRMVSRMFGRLPLRHVHPDEAIALGACVAAGLKARDQRLDEVILTDVCPYTLGTAVARRDGDGQLQSGFFHPIIHRNSVVPTSREESFWPTHPQQKTLRLDVYQGENPMVANNIKLGELQLEIDPRLPAEQNAVKVRFTYDINGVLQVEATVQATGKQYELVLERNPGLLLDPEQVRQRLAMLAELKVHPRDKQENIALLARAERLYEERLQARDQLQAWIARFRAAIETQDELLIREHRREFDHALNTLEQA
jgi:molecular chaperone HscC